jgi:hypothetical protein
MTRSFTATVCLGLALLALPASVSAQTSLNKRVTIDVTEVAPRQVMELLARAVGCTIEDGSGSLQSIKTLLGMKEQCRFFVDPAVTQPLTMRLVDVPVYSVLPMICQSIGCEYRFDGTNVWLKPLSGGRKRDDAARMAYYRKMQAPLPQNMRFVNVTLANVLRALSAASGMDLEPWKDEGNRMVTIDVSGKSLDQALQAIVSQIDGYGYVRVRTWDGSMAWLGLKGPKALRAGK